MCIGIPMQVVGAERGATVCVGRGRRETIDTALVGAVPVGAWLLAYHGTAIRTMTAEEAAQTDAALDALEAAMAGDTSLDRFFADLVGREPELPAHLREKTR